MSVRLWRAASAASSATVPASSAAEAPTLSQWALARGQRGVNGARASRGDSICAAVVFAAGLVGCVKVRHHRFQGERENRRVKRASRAGRRSRSAPWRLMPVSISRWTGMDAGENPCGTRVALQFVNLPALPDHRCESILKHCRGLSWEHTADDDDARMGAEGARGYAFFHAGDAEPARPGADRGGCAERERVAVGVGLHDGEALGAAPPIAAGIGSCLRARGC